MSTPADDSASDRDFEKRYDAWAEQEGVRGYPGSEWGDAGFGDPTAGGTSYGGVGDGGSGHGDAGYSDQQFDAPRSGAAYGQPPAAVDGFDSGRYGAQPLPGGDQSFGAYPYGQQQYGQPDYGQHQYGQPEYGTQPYGQPYGATQPYAQPYGAMQPYGQPYGAMQPYGQYPPAARKEPALMLVASLLIPGLGTMLNGRVGRGVGIFLGYSVGVLLSIVLIGLPIMLGFWVWGMVDAYQGAKDHNARHGLP
ncbi:hypothetical protein [Dietzia sp. CH92]|uniref:hypothetical protein n=1 Tax=Dietzia sp. CH92 TaxID=3051823 RepID=UPI0028D1C391|nr:hypothetical protein [Dietzia sp. CH92]